MEWKRETHLEVESPRVPLRREQGHTAVTLAAVWDIKSAKARS